MLQLLTGATVCLFFLLGVSPSCHGSRAEQMAGSVDAVQLEVQTTGVAHYLACEVKEEPMLYKL